MADDLSLFPDDAPPGGDRSAGSRAPGGGEASGTAPLAARMRPRTVDEFVGQEHLLAPGRALRALLEGDVPSSFILWGPPGTGKTTLAHLLADASDASFVGFSAVTEGVARVREIIAEAGERLRATGRRTILFCDEIHRFNKGQQDAFLPHVEAGTVVLVGATTENPSFEVVRPLLSRAPVFVLEPLSEKDLRKVLERALREERGLGGMELEWEGEALRLLSRGADGDARRALGALEAAAGLVGRGGTIDADAAAEALQHRFAAHDKSGEAHYDILSAYHKSLRGSDPQGALYWMARMIEGGEDPMVLFRRALAMAAEDVGLADPDALRIAVAARDAYHHLGPPEGYLPLAEMTIYLATAPKSNRAKIALGEARRAARETPAAPVPLHLRNAPTDLMKELGYGKEYLYDHDQPHGVSAQAYLPESLAGREFYRPGTHGYEETLARRLAWWAERREEQRRAGEDAGNEESGPTEADPGAADRG